jgi:diguanylate cyclase (GGDEF)-like protein/PAS domain S-box-containing protein
MDDRAEDPAEGAGIQRSALALRAARVSRSTGEDIAYGQDPDERFRALVHNSFDAIVISDHENVITYATPAIRTLFGHDPSELIGKSGFSYQHPDDRSRSIENARQLLARPGSASLQTFRLRHSDGSYRWVECTSVNLLDHRHVHGILNTFRDVTDRKEADDRVRSNEERLSALLTNADGAILILDARGLVTWCSPSGEHLWGLGNESMLGASMVRLVHPDDRREVFRQFSKLATSAQGATVRVEARMRHQDGSWRWYESIFTNRLDEPSIEGVIANMRDTTERVMQEQALRDSESRLEHQATHDPLTGLPNRTLMRDRLDVALGRGRRNGSGLAILFCDIDHFKVVNDSLGHSQGDALLIEVAARLAEAVRGGDTIARFGGDEFVILAEDLAGADQAVVLADRIERALSQPFVMNDAEIFVTMSTGIAYGEAEELEVETLLRDADAAMYQAKSRGRARAEIFDDAMRARAVDRHQIETALRRAVARRQLQLHYQPVIELAHQRMVGTEALVRWKHPSRGLLYPGTFITVAEDTGLIVPLGAWILDQSCAQTEAWRNLPAPPTSSALAAGPDPDDLFVAVNLSARQLSDASLIDDIASVLAATRLDPRRLHLEITESVLMHDVDASKEVLDRLKVLGVRIAIDDFGTGYSSFSYLRRFPVDILKIDQSFVAGLETDAEADAIVHAIVDLGHTLGLEVVAEGVETEGQLGRLREMGCDFAQGYLLSRPVPPARIHDLLAAGGTWPRP